MWGSGGIIIIIIIYLKNKLPKRWDTDEKNNLLL